MCVNDDDDGWVTKKSRFKKGITTIIIEQKIKTDRNFKTIMQK